MDISYKVPVENVNDKFVIIADLHFDSGDYVSEGDIIYTFETSKAIVDVEAECDGYIFYVAEVNQEIKVGSLVCIISNDKDFDITDLKCETSKDDIEAADFKLTKKAKELAEKLKINLDDLNLKGIIREHDLLSVINKKTKE